MNRNRTETQKKENFISGTTLLDPKSEYIHKFDPQNHNSEPDFQIPDYFDSHLMNKERKQSILFHIKLDPSTQKTIHCDLHDDPFCVASSFCKEHDLPNEVVPAISKLIEDEFRKASKPLGDRTKTSKKSSVISNNNRVMREMKIRINSENERSRSSERLAVSRKLSHDERNSRGTVLQSKIPHIITKFNVRVSENETKELLLIEGEQPELVAYKFQIENNLPSDLLEILVQKLKEAKEMDEKRNPKQLKGRLSTKQTITQERTEANLPHGDRHTIKHEKLLNEGVTNFPQFEPPDYLRSDKNNGIQSKQIFYEKGTNNKLIDSQYKTKEANYFEPIQTRNTNILNYFQAVVDKTKQKNPANPIDYQSERKRSSSPINEPNRSQVEQTLENKVPKSNSNVKPLTNEAKQQTKSKKTEGDRHWTARSLTPPEKNSLAQKNSIQSASHVTDRLYREALEKQSIRSLNQSPFNKNKPANKLAVFNYGPKNKTPIKEKKRKGKNLWGEEFIEGYTPSQRMAKGLIKLEKERKETHPYTPYVSEMSRMLAAKRDRSISPALVHNKLHEEAEKNKKNRFMLEQLTLEESCPFKPKILEYQSQNGDEKDFLSRLADRQKSTEGKGKKLDEQDYTWDSVTGQKLFHPKINKDKYYDMANIKDQLRVKEAKEEKERKLFIHSPNKNDFNEHSTVFQKIFKKLDDDRDGFISPHKIQLSELDPTTIELLLHVIGIIEENKLELDYKGFHQLLEEELSLEEKEALTLQFHKQGPINSVNSIKGIAQGLQRDEVESIDFAYRNAPHFEHIDLDDSKNSRKFDNHHGYMEHLTKHYQKLIGNK